MRSAFDPFAPASPRWGRARHPGRSRDGGSPRILVFGNESAGGRGGGSPSALVRALAAGFPGAGVLAVADAPQRVSSPLPARVEFVGLPGGPGSSLPGSPTFRLLLRRTLLQSTFRSFAPDLLVVDHDVLGQGGELSSLLREARRRGTRTLLVLRDVIGAPQALLRDWGHAEARWALREGYDHILVLGTREVFDPTVEYPFLSGLSGSTERLSFGGYLAPPETEAAATGRHGLRSEQRRVLVLDAESDGGALLELVLAAHGTRTPGWETVLVGRPRDGCGSARRWTLERDGLLAGVTLLDSDEPLSACLSACDAVVSGAGYNAVAEIVRAARPAVLVPRLDPRREEEIRATRLAHLGLARSVFGSNPTELRSVIERALNHPPPIDGIPCTEGSTQLCRVAGDLLSSPFHPVRVPYHHPVS